MGLPEGSRNAAVTMRRLRRMAVSMTLMYIFSYGLTNRWTIRTVRAARLIRNWGRKEGVNRQYTRYTTLLKKKNLRNMY